MGVSANTFEFIEQISIYISEDYRVVSGGSGCF